MNITIDRYTPGDVESSVWLTLDGVEYDVVFDSENLNRLKVMKDDSEVELAAEYHEAVVARIELLLTFFDNRALQQYIRDLAEEAIAAMEQHLVQVKESGW